MVEAPTMAAAKKPTPSTNKSPTHPLLGQPAPAFQLNADDGKSYSLQDFAGKYLILFFYPKDNTPGCTREACSFQENYAALKKAGAHVVGISRDSLKSHGNFKTKFGLTYPLLSDPDTTIHRAYGAWGMKKLYGKESEGVLRTTAIIDPQGNLVHLISPVKVDGHVEQVQSILQQLKTDSA
jgi:thioredoxin-dependent peroxiredoxin